MTSNAKIILAVLSGRSDNNISFADLRKLLVSLGFSERTKGDHHIYIKSGVAEILSIQPMGSKAKAYQVNQVRGIILKYQL